MALLHGNLFLVGLMGAGKTTFGRMLAEDFDKTFIDADVEIERREQRLIKDIFAEDGEAHFRDLEQACIDTIVGQENLVLATGGGVVLRPANREKLRSRGTVVYLYVPEEILVARLTHAAANRPLLNNSDDLLKRLRDLYQERDALYRETAHYVHCETTDIFPYTTLQQLIETIVSA